MLTAMITRRLASVTFATVLAFSLLLGACTKTTGTAASTSPPTTSPSTITDPADYVARVCASGATWERAVQQGASDFTTAQIGVTDLNAIRQNLVDYLNALAMDTDAFVSAVEGAGAPPVADGASVQTAVLAALRSGAQSYRDAATQAQSLPTSDPTAFTAGVRTLAATIGKESKAMGDSLTGIKNPVLDPLFKANSDCNPPKGGA